MNHVKYNIPLQRGMGAIDWQLEINLTRGCLCWRSPSCSDSHLPPASFRFVSGQTSLCFNSLWISHLSVLFFFFFWELQFGWIKGTWRHVWQLLGAESSSPNFLLRRLTALEGKTEVKSSSPSGIVTGTLWRRPHLSFFHKVLTLSRFLFSHPLWYQMK